jgi:hypothetical protein
LREENGQRRYDLVRLDCVRDLCSCAILDKELVYPPYYIYSDTNKVLLKVNKLNERLYILHSGLSLSENQGDIKDYLPYLYDLEELIQIAREDHSILDDFDPDGINNQYRAEGNVFCEYDDEWQSKERHQGCSCDDEEE